ncbi:Transcriptional regulator GlxA family, contains an amidase domain and an AraC-type DNA-binding HTH domain [Andreprevotia lacus DSM 23236]|jgi:transcriptional regulator GlxA family with amidase domain|uniref:Transcriptional regulator GlxA family, contains an amidase domain and an AraC-type DNA-binding HTH domain n=1 Tax=Andreprevotia lacus DSM 23236 TaxID=1121001 RepID=A0A1W1XUR2_9NEIS|nr:helix-turn-helix domain-containing protein [Andreprevotia lacus]SMC27602.1 Transcriptional regulator GlxA family, contains an amidase domain and an AraC-type DNA-binding HTH domain [Andreprevotia lacus DSM 23236]
MFEIGLLLYPGCMPAGLLATVDLLQAANRRSGRRLFGWRWLGVEAGPVACAHGVTLQTDVALADAGCAAVLVAGMWAESIAEVEQVLSEQQSLLRALRALPTAVQLWSYCTGVALAAASGRLDGHAATATWWMAPWQQQRHPQVDWQWQRTCVFNLHNASASGAHGYLPIVSGMLEQKLPPELWRDLARLLVLPRPQPVASVFQALALIGIADPWLRRLRLAIEDCPAGALTVARLAEVMAVSPRTLARKAAAAGADGVGEYARRVKLNQVAEQLAHTALPLVRIADALGFADETSLRRAFRQVSGMTPAEYRRAYQA